MNARRVSVLPTLAVVLAAGTLLAAAGALQAIRERRFAPAVGAEAALYLTSGATVSRLTRGYNALAADLYWIRAIQHYGRNKVRVGRAVPTGASATQATDYQLLYPLLDLTTTLDPHFNIAYRFGAVFLAEPPPGGPGQSDQAIALLAKGLQAQPDKWEYMQDIGFVHYWWLRDFKTAAQWFARAAERPNAAEWLRPLSATTLAYGGDRNSSRLLWRQRFEATDSPWLRENAAHRLQQLDTMDAIDTLNQIAGRFTARQGRPPSDWRELIVAERLRGIPLDPSGKAFVLDPATGRVDLAGDSPLRPLPTAEEAAGSPPR